MWQKLTWRATFITLLQSIVHNNKNVKYDMSIWMFSRVHTEKTNFTVFYQSHSTWREKFSYEYNIHTFYIPVSMALLSFVFHSSATSLARGSSGFGALRSAWIDRRTVRIWRAGLHLSTVVENKISIPVHPRINNVDIR